MVRLCSVYVEDEEIRRGRPTARVWRGKGGLPAASRIDDLARASAERNERSESSARSAKAENICKNQVRSVDVDEGRQ